MRSLIRPPACSISTARSTSINARSSGTDSAKKGTPVPTVLTCGLAEENLHNNQEMAETLRRQGYPVTMAEVPDAHNYTGWRDAFDPYLTDLLRNVWG